MREFCSTRITEMPSSRSIATIERAMSWTSLGAMPSEGSCSDISARLMTTFSARRRSWCQSSWLQRSLSRLRTIAIWGNV
jgi:hypothetical protein